MPFETPITITLYNPKTNEPLKSYSRTFIPWKLFKSAVRLSKSLYKMDVESLNEEDVDAIAGLVVDVFGGQFTLDELNDGADAVEMIAVMNAIVERASGLLSNPPPPAK